MIRSPISGQVLRVFQESATVVQAGAQLLELGDPEDLEVEVDVLSSDAVKIRPGAKAAPGAVGRRPALRATVRLIEPSAFTEDLGTGRGGTAGERDPGPGRPAGTTPRAGRWLSRRSPDRRSGSRTTCCRFPPGPCSAAATTGPPSSSPGPGRPAHRPSASATAWPPRSSTDCGEGDQVILLPQRQGAGRQPGPAARRHGDVRRRDLTVRSCL